jgi:uncharacterized membrane-anchored protein
MKGPMHLTRSLVVTVCALTVFVGHLFAADPVEDPLVASKVKWTRGPASVSIGSQANFEIPAGIVFTDGSGARRLLEFSGNIPDGSELGLFAPTNLEWFAIFDFSEEGYVKDDDKDKLDADKMLAAIKKGNEAGNAERKKRGWPLMKIVGWDQPPAYDSETHNLGWAIRVESDGGQSVNYNTRLLGRKGIMSVNLVIDPEKLPATLPEYKQMLAKYDYKPGERYSEFKQGDKIAKYGLAALVVGGAAAGAAKLGLFGTIAVFFKKAWKLVIIAVVAIGAFIKRIVLGRNKTTIDS